MKNYQTIFLGLIMPFLYACQNAAEQASQNTFPAYPPLVSEIGANSITAQLRLSATDTLVQHEEDPKINWHRPGKEGWVRFQVAADQEFASPLFTGNWQKAVASNDFIAREKINNLAADKKYHLRAHFGEDTLNWEQTTATNFCTLPGKDSDTPFSLVMVTGMHIHRFLNGGTGGGGGPVIPAATETDAALGFPGLSFILAEQPGLFIGNGDIVYYDHPGTLAAENIQQMRAHWHRLFQMPRLQELAKTTSFLWLKDDHDFRYDDADLTDYPKDDSVARPLPTAEDGLMVFKEQVAGFDLDDSKQLPYRSFRINQHLQLWLVEGRDFRSANLSEVEPEKSIWGEQQKEWLKRTLKESDATFKVLISPTPMVGPDDKWKKDNHTNAGGFRHEGEAFFAWLSENGFDPNQFFIFCGDRHWQYHSIHPSGFEEFSCGALVDANSRLGQLPGEEDSTDPDAKIKQPFTVSEISGGFLKATVTRKPSIKIEFFNNKGKLLYQVEKLAATE